MIDKTVLHYTILEKAGEGGMGVVYKAEDTKLKRIVALKFLSPEFTRDEESKARFIQEAQAAAALDHPNICTIYDITETKERIFIVMAFVSGKSLKQRMESGPLDVEMCLDISSQVAEGLQAAHEQGIVHRDIKPGNIMLSERGRVKIMDFGLAKLEWGADLTKTATIMGTIAYMSPEQVRGETTDRRTDIWSLGCVLYEMLSGRRAFQGGTDLATLHAILNQDPEPLSSLRPNIPDFISHADAKALQKDVTLRYQTVREFASDLGKASPVVTKTPTKEKSIVVLPFENMSPDKENEYFSDGLTEEIITDLSQIKELQVISRTSARHLKGTQKDLKAIGRELNVHYVLEGSVRKQRNDLRITAQLIDAGTDVHLWAEKYKGTVDDVFDIQEKVSKSIADALKLKLSPEEHEKISERPIADIRAYECYLQARQEMWRFTEEGLEHALQLIKNGLRIVGENALLYAALGTAYWLFVNAGIKPDERNINKTEECAQKIFVLAPHSPHGYFLKGVVHVHQGNMQQAVRDLKKALESDPNNADILLQLCRVYSSCGKTTAAAPLVNKLLETDPLNTITYSLPGYLAVLEGRFDKAPHYYKKMYQMDSHNPVSIWFYAWALIFAGRNEKAYALIDELAKKASGTIYAQLGLFIKYALQRKKKEAEQAVGPEMERAAKGVEYLSRDMAHGYALIGNKRKALDWLENAIDLGFIAYPFLNDHDTFLENIKGEERFKKLIQRVKKEWEDFEV